MHRKTGEVDGDHVLPLLLVVVGESRAVASDAGVVEGAVEAAESVDAGVDECLHLVGDGDVAADEH
jgi:hypothetical protein